MSASISLPAGSAMPTVADGGDDDGQRPAASARAPRSLVGGAADDRARPGWIRRVLLHRGHPERELLRRSVPLAVLFALPHHRVRASDVRADRRLVHVVAGAPHRRFAAHVPCHLLLLPPLVLPRVLLVATGVHRAG